jgi:hypothetical protein
MSLGLCEDTNNFAYIIDDKNKQVGTISLEDHNNGVESIELEKGFKL